MTVSAKPTLEHMGTTDKAAAAVGVAPSSFRAWAADRGLKAVRHVRLGRSSVALWDLDQVFEAERNGVVRRK